jgi:hypothetical protein
VAQSLVGRAPCRRAPGKTHLAAGRGSFARIAPRSRRRATWSLSPSSSAVGGRTLRRNVVCRDGRNNVCPAMSDLASLARIEGIDLFGERGRRVFAIRPPRRRRHSQIVCRMPTRRRCGELSWLVRLANVRGTIEHVNVTSVRLPVLRLCRSPPAMPEREADDYRSGLGGALL